MRRIVSTKNKLRHVYIRRLHGKNTTSPSLLISSIFFFFRLLNRNTLINAIQLEGGVAIAKPTAQLINYDRQWLSVFQFRLLNLF